MLVETISSKTAEEQYEQLEAAYVLNSYSNTDYFFLLFPQLLAQSKKNPLNWSGTVLRLQNCMLLIKKVCEIGLLMSFLFSIPGIIVGRKSPQHDTNTSAIRVA